MNCSRFVCQATDLRAGTSVFVRIDSRLFVNSLIDELRDDAKVSSVAIARVAHLPPGAQAANAAAVVRSLPSLH